jgi:hypothetical protein
MFSGAFNKCGPHALPVKSPLSLDEAVELKAFSYCDEV